MTYQLPRWVVESSIMLTPTISNGLCTGIGCKGSLAPLPPPLTIALSGQFLAKFTASQYIPSHHQVVASIWWRRFPEKWTAYMDHDESLPSTVSEGDMVQLLEASYLCQLDKEHHLPRRTGGFQEQSVLPAAYHQVISSLPKLKDLQQFGILPLFLQGCGLNS